MSIRDMIVPDEPGDDQPMTEAKLDLASNQLRFTVRRRDDEYLAGLLQRAADAIDGLQDMMAMSDPDYEASCAAIVRELREAIA